ncbi:cytochrome P450 [Planctomycetaceae bacterium SCGC AG-212-F19]|nr:cytochrome P450 [Planctomycetaceae bacterium SCGC AG-212-F19]
MLTGNWPEFRRNRLEFLSRCAREFGDVVGMRLGPHRVVVLNHPDLVEEVLVTQARHFIKHFALRVNPLVLGKGLLTSDGDFWLRQRRLMQPAFNRGRVGRYAPVMTEYAERMLTRWQQGQTFDVFAEMSRLTLEIAAKTLFDAEAGDKANEVGRALEVLLEAFLTRVHRLWAPPSWVPTPRNVRFRRALRRLDEIIYGFIAQRRSQPEQHHDFLSILLNARDEQDHTGMTDRQVRDEAMTLFLAGHETTALALTWTWYLLARHPEIEQKAADEARTVLGDRTATAEDWPRLRLTEQVVRETMRLYPPAFIIGRESIADVSIAGYRLPRGTTILMSTWVLHRDARFWPAADTFDPGRWTEAAERDRPRFAYFPFGGGPRLCIGNHFAMMEAVLVLATIARRYRFALAGEEPVAPAPTFTLRPERSIVARVSLRASEE